MSDEGFDSVLASAQAGGEWAFAALYRRHNPPVLRYLRANVGDDGDDLASQTWMDVARNLSGFEGDRDAFAGWIFTIARRRLVDHRRRGGRRREAPADQLPADLGDDRADPATVALDALAGDAAARRVVELLPTRQAEVVLLRVLGGLSVAEVAAVTGQRPGTVRVLHHRGLRRLAERLAGDV